MTLNKELKTLLVSFAVLLAAGCAATEEKPEPAPEVAEAQPEPAPTPEPAANPNDSYTVVSGDHLWGISSKPRIYGNPYHWPLIYKANSDKIEDADLIHPGQIFTIDRNATGADIDAAVEHAKTRGAWTLGAVESSDQEYLRR